MNNGSSPHKARNHLGIINSVLEYLRTEKTAANIAVLVEGPDDEKIYRKFLRQGIAQTFVCTGKSDLQKALSGLVDKTNNAIGIRDADFCNLENIQPENQNLFFTDGHDIETTMLGFKAIRWALFSEYGDWHNMNTVWESIVKKASFIGYIRWFNEKNDFRMFFEGFFNKYGNIDEEQLLLDKLNKKSQEKKRPITKTMIDDFIITHKTNDAFNLCNGHDICTLLAATFTINTKLLSLSLRLSFQLNHFMQTNLYAKILAWQQTNHFDILETQPGASNG
jgi:hypothetical protein